jgi:hypothetical protein
MRKWYGVFFCLGPQAEDSYTELKRGQLNVCNVNVYCEWCTLLAPVAEICVR